MTRKTTQQKTEESVPAEGQTEGVVLAEGRSEEVALTEAQTEEIVPTEGQALGSDHHPVISLETEGENSDLHENNTNAKESPENAEGKSATSQEKVLQSNQALPGKPTFYDAFAYVHEEDIILEVQALDAPFVRGGVRFSREPVFVVVDDNHQSHQSKAKAIYVSVDEALQIYKEAQKGVALKLLRYQYIEELEKYA